MKHLMSAVVLTLVNCFSRLFFRVEAEWINTNTSDPWKTYRSDDLRVVALLNHTSLWEPIFTAVIPLRFLWFMAGRLLVPGADKTMQRPIVGTFYRLLTPATVSISRKRDGTWEGFLARIAPKTIVLLAPEGRMKRPNGLDSKGQPMTVRGGIADILQAIPKGTMVLCYSGGLHHIQAPGEFFPRLFKRARIRLEPIDIETYRQGFQGSDIPLKLAVARDLEQRMQRNCPPAQ
jgi:1-acyl-sn-glycerol-3-phosphate acyltransferase